MTTIVQSPTDIFSTPSLRCEKVSVGVFSVVVMSIASYRSQPSLEDLGTLLSEVTFVVVDLETTGGGDDAKITEIGAVKVRGGQVLGEFQTLVNPQDHIPALIAVLTGITNQLVADAPIIRQALPPFLEFARGSVLVAHNAGFDIGFLKRNCAQLDLAWPAPAVIDTVALARQVLLRDEVPNCKLSTLAAHFRAETTPNHRALSDARATVSVLHGLIERVGNLGVHTLEDLTEFTHRVSPQRRAKRVWANDLPDQPGVYCFYSDKTTPPSRGGRAGVPDDQGREVLYVGKSVNIRTRVRSYFTAAEKRARMEEMVRVSTGVAAYPCATPLEAEVRELRLIQAHSPRYNRRSRNQDRLVWLKLTNEHFARLSIVRQVRPDGADYLGPFSSTQAADDAALACYDTFALRQCTKRLSIRTPTSACALSEMGKCCAPCELGTGADAYPDLVARVRHALLRDSSEIVRQVGSRMAKLASQQRFEEAEIARRRLSGYTRAALRWQRIRSLASCSEIVAAAPVLERPGQWHIHVIRYGRLAAAATSKRTEIPQAIARDAVLMAESVVPPDTGLPACSIEEAERVAAWLESPGVRIIDIDGTWAWPIGIGPVFDASATHPSTAS